MAAALAAAPAALSSRVAAVARGSNRNDYLASKRGSGGKMSASAGAGAGASSRRCAVSVVAEVDETLNPRVASLRESKTMALTDLARSMKESGQDVIGLAAGVGLALSTYFGDSSGGGGGT
jgi:hypothetical protein